MQPTLDLFSTAPVEGVNTEGVKYAGSKLRLLPYILGLVKRVGAQTVLDGFSGTTRVSQALSKCGYNVVSNDISEWSRIFASCYLLNKRDRQSYRPLIDHLNSVSPETGWFTEHYGGLPEEGIKRPWQIHNTRKLDGIREEIERLRLDPLERAVALTSLILALDKVDSTLGHFASYLKEWSPRSYKPMNLEIPMLFPNVHDHKVLRGNILDMAPTISADLAYYDPPYGSNNEKMPPSRVRYAAYYHVWTSICLFDTPKLFGRANRREDSSDRERHSVFEEFRQSSTGRYLAVEALDRLLRITPTPWIVLSYGSGGRATADELNEVIRSNGELVDVLEINHKKNVMSGMRWTHEWVRQADESNREFLFLIRNRRRTG